MQQPQSSVICAQRTFPRSLPEAVRAIADSRVSSDFRSGPYLDASGRLSPLCFEGPAHACTPALFSIHPQLTRHQLFICISGGKFVKTGTRSAQCETRNADTFRQEQPECKIPRGEKPRRQGVAWNYSLPFSIDGCATRRSRMDGGLYEHQSNSLEGRRAADQTPEPIPIRILQEGSNRIECLEKEVIPIEIRVHLTLLKLSPPNQTNDFKLVNTRG